MAFIIQQLVRRADDTHVHTFSAPHALRLRAPRNNIGCHFDWLTAREGAAPLEQTGPKRLSERQMAATFTTTMVAIQ